MQAVHDIRRSSRPERRPATSGTVVARLRERDPYRYLEPQLLRLAAMSADDPVRARLRSELVVGFTPVCRNVARRFVRQGELLEDLEQVAAIGLLKALDRFRPAGADPVTSFLGYVVPTISGEIQRHLRDHTWAVHVPRPVKDLRSPLWRAVSEFSRDHGRPPRPSELAAHLGVDRELVIETLGAEAARRPASMDAPVGPQGQRLVDGLGHLDDALVGVENRTQLREALRVLPARDARILVLRFVDEMTQSQIGAELGLSQMHVSRLLARSLATLRDHLAA